MTSISYQLSGNLMPRVASARLYRSRREEAQIDGAVQTVVLVRDSPRVRDSELEKFAARIDRP